MLNVVFEHPTSDQTAEAAVDPDHTPQNLIDYLIENDFLSPAKPQTSYGMMNTRSGSILDADSGFGSQDIQEKDRLKITIDALGAAPEEGRLKMDFASGKCLIAQKSCVTGFAAYTDRTRKRPITSYEQSHLATYYLVRYQIPLPINRRERFNSFVLSYDLSTVMEDYPDNEIHVVTAVSNPKPWHHRIHAATGKFCTGGHRDAGFLLGDIIVQIARMLNFSEPKHLLARTSDRGYDYDAYKFYDKTFGGPVHARLAIPEVTTAGLVAHQTDRSIKLKINGSKIVAPPRVSTTSPRPAPPKIEFNKPR